MSLADENITKKKWKQRCKVFLKITVQNNEDEALDQYLWKKIPNQKVV